MKVRLFLLSFLAFAIFSACTLSNGNSSACPSGQEKNDEGECVGSSNPGGDSSSSNGNNNGGGDPQGGPYAVLPSNMNKQKVQEMYNSWMNTYYITFEQDAGSGSFNPDFAPDEAKGTARIKSKYNTCSTKGECTASEAMGYGMILASLMEDWERYGKLLAYSKVFRISGTALMMWDISDFRSGSGGSATDADIDICASLFIAYEKTKKQAYLDDAIEIGKSIYEFEVDRNTKLILPAMNNEAMGNGQLYNISYLSLPALGMLAKHDRGNGRDWDAVLEANIAYMERVQNGGDGLWPDWSNASGEPANPGNGTSNNLTASAASGGGTVPSHAAYYKETPRIPWRIAWYYHWFGNQRAKTMLDKGMYFLRNTKGVQNSEGIKDFYSYTGGKESGSPASVIRWASLCALGMGSQENLDWLNSCNERIFRENFTTAVSDYYRNSLHLIYAMLFNGKF